MPQSAIFVRTLPLSTRPEDFFGPALPPTSSGYRVCPTLADDKLPSRSPFGGLQRSFLFARHLYPSLSIFFFHGALSPREPAKRCSPACALHPGYIKGISACHLVTWPACQSPSIIPTWILYRAHPPRTSATWCWLRASIEYTSIEVEKAILISSS